jgi:soluble lytic murein transglycosylase-like protein
MAKTESNFNPHAVSSHEAVGIMQILPSTARALGVSPSSLTNPEVSFSTSAKYLAMLQSQFGSLRMATVAYNQGEGNVRNGSYRTWYYDKVQANYNTLKR